MNIVHYTHLNTPPQVGLGVTIYPVDHPSMMVGNNRPAYTSPVQAIDVTTGTIVTRNTVYVPISIQVRNEWNLNG